MSGKGPDHWMRRAVALARRGFPAPNPHVGCVIVRDAEVVGEGWHEAAGGPHAEVNALAQAGDRANGSTMYVTLEPCDHFGRTPPCSQAVIAASIRCVEVAVADPCGQAAGGIQRLRAAGLTVAVGRGAAWAERVNEVFLTSVRHRRPYVCIKAATTMDGYIARSDGTSKWITGEAARAEGHRLRAEMGAVLVGRRTVEEDDPELTARIAGVVNQPTRVVLDPGGRLTGRERVFNDAAPTLWCVGPDLGGPRRTVVPIRPDGGFDLPALLARLDVEGLRGVLVEGGGATIGRFLDAGLYDRIERFVAPVTFGSGVPWTGGAPWPEGRLAQRRRRPLGPDEHWTWARSGPLGP